MLLGLEDVNGNGGTDPTRFTYVDGTTDQTFYRDEGEFPWGHDQPNNLGGDQDYVEYVKHALMSLNLGFA